MHCVPAVWAEVRRGPWIPWELADRCELFSGCWAPNLGSLQEQQVPLLRNLSSVKVARETFKKSVMCEGWKKETSKSTLHLQKLAVRKMDWSCA